MDHDFIIYQNTFLLNILLYDPHPSRNFFLLNPSIYYIKYFNFLLDQDENS